MSHSKCHFYFIHKRNKRSEWYFLSRYCRCALELWLWSSHLLCAAVLFSLGYVLEQYDSIILYIFKCIFQLLLANNHFHELIFSLTLITFSKFFIAMIIFKILQCYDNCFRNTFCWSRWPRNDCCHMVKKNLPSTFALPEKQCRTELCRKNPVMPYGKSPPLKIPWQANSERMLNRDCWWGVVCGFFLTLVFSFVLFLQVTLLGA